jgi:hypothetical protein
MSEREKEDFFIGQIILDLQRADIREGDANILSLAAGVAAHHMGIPEERRAGVPVCLLHQMCVGIGIVAGGP